MSITTGFLTKPTGTTNNTSNQDLGSIFVAQNNSHNVHNNFSFNLDNIPAKTFTKVNNLSFTNVGTYLLSINVYSSTSGNANLYNYFLVICQSTPSFSSSEGFVNFEYATPIIPANDSNNYNGIPLSYTTIFNVITNDYYVYCYNYINDNTITINVTLDAILLTPTETTYTPTSL